MNRAPVANCCLPPLQVAGLWVMLGISLLAASCILVLLYIRRRRAAVQAALLQRLPTVARAASAKLVWSASFASRTNVRGPVGAPATRQPL